MDEYATHRGRSTLAAASLIGIATAAAVVAMQRRRTSGAGPGAAERAVHVHEAITINRPLAEVYQFWRNFENFPSFMSHLESVESTGGGRSRWRAKGPAGLRVQWEADIVGERENQWIAWRSIEGSGVQHSGSVRFEHAPAGRGTEVHAELQYHRRGGPVGQTIARLLGRDPEQQIRHDLRRFKQLLETGEIPVSDGPGLWRPAQPPERPQELKSYMGVLR